MKQANWHDTPAADRPEARFEASAAASLRAALDGRGFVRLPALLDQADCQALRALYEKDECFRSTIVMARHAFGDGEYRYFQYPLPALVESLRHAAYAALAPLANAWSAKLGLDRHYPDRLDAFLADCAAAGQRRATPLLLKYEAGGYNCLHQDLYGDLSFPFQMAVLLSRPGADPTVEGSSAGDPTEGDFTGGEFLLVEQRPRAQSRGQVVPLRQGDAVIFANDQRPVEGRRGYVRRRLRHGVSEVTSGTRHTLGLIFHDAT